MSQNLTFGAGGSYRGYEQLSQPRQYTFRDPDDTACDTTDYSSRNITRTDRDQPSYQLYGSVNYSRLLTKRSRWSLEYRCTYAGNSVDRNTYVLTAENTFPAERNPKQSSEYDYSYLTHRIGTTYQYRFRKTKVATTLYYQHAGFSGDYAFPYPAKTEAAFDNLTYNAVADRHQSKQYVEIQRLGAHVESQATDLQNIVNTTNRQNVVAGNRISYPSTPTGSRGSTSAPTPPRGGPSPSRPNSPPAPTPLPTRW